jgi:hypothetical protein
MMEPGSEDIPKKDLKGGDDNVEKKRKACMTRSS